MASAGVVAAIMVILAILVVVALVAWGFHMDKKKKLMMSPQSSKDIEMTDFSSQQTAVLTPESFSSEMSPLKTSTPPTVPVAPVAVVPISPVPSAEERKKFCRNLLASPPEWSAEAEAESGITRREVIDTWKGRRDVKECLTLIPLTASKLNI